MEYDMHDLEFVPSTSIWYHVVYLCTMHEWLVVLLWMYVRRRPYELWININIIYLLFLFILKYPKPNTGDSSFFSLYLYLLSSEFFLSYFLKPSRVNYLIFKTIPSS
jgi:hypothetical protein